MPATMSVIPGFEHLSEIYNSYNPSNFSAQQLNNIEQVNSKEIPSSVSTDDSSSGKDYFDWFNSMKEGFDSYTKETSDKIDQFLQEIKDIKEKEGTNYDFYEQFLKTGEIAYLEAYLQNKLAQENEASARSWEEQMSNTAFSRLMADIKRSGYNPWLALQNGFGQASYGSSSAAGVSGVSASSQMTTKRGQDINRENNKSNNATKFATAFISAMVKMFSAVLQAGATIGSSVIGNS